MLFEGYPDPPQPGEGKTAATSCPACRFPPNPDRCPDGCWCDCHLTQSEKNHRARRKTIDNRKARQGEAIKNGVHPLNGRPLANNGHTCGDCGHRYVRTMGGRYQKCDLGPNTHGPGTDLLASWPACVLWEEKHGTV